MITMSTITTAMAMSIHSHLRRLFCRDRALLGASMIPTMPVTTASNRKQQQTPLHAHWRLPLEPRAELAFADLACAYITSPGHGWAILVPSLFKSVYPVRACAPLTLYRQWTCVPCYKLVSESFSDSLCATRRRRRETSRVYLACRCCIG